MPTYQRKCPKTSSENEKDEVHCRHIPSCTKWMHRHTRNKHWQTMLHNEAHTQGECMRCVRISTAHPWFFFMSAVDAGDADDEGSSSEAEEPAVNPSSEGFSSEYPAVDLYDKDCSSEKAAVEHSDEHSGTEGSAVELSDEGGSTSETSDDNLSQQPLAALQTPPLYFPASPAPDEAVVDEGFNMEGYDEQYDIISSCYTSEEEVCSSPFNVLD